MSQIESKRFSVSPTVAVMLAFSFSGIGTNVRLSMWSSERTLRSSSDTCSPSEDEEPVWTASTLCHHFNFDSFNGVAISFPEENLDLIHCREETDQSVWSRLPHDPAEGVYTKLDLLSALLTHQLRNLVLYLGLGLLKWRRLASKAVHHDEGSEKCSTL